jgi:hypothetical protein
MWVLFALYLSSILGLALASSTPTADLDARSRSAVAGGAPYALLCILGATLFELSIPGVTTAVQAIAGVAGMSCAVVLIDERPTFADRDQVALVVGLAAATLGGGIHNGEPAGATLAIAILAVVGVLVGTWIAPGVRFSVRGARAVAGIMCAGAGAQLIGEIVQGT